MLDVPNNWSQKLKLGNVEGRNLMITAVPEDSTGLALFVFMILFNSLLVVFLPFASLSVPTGGHLLTSGIFKVILSLLFSP